MESSTTIETNDIKLEVEEKATPKKRKKREIIKNICILDAVTGYLLFERKYKWPERVMAPNLSSLIRSFYQFSREVDDGNIASVNFEGGKSRKGKGKDNFKHRSLNTTFDTMQMVCVRSDKIVVSVFYDMHGELVPSSALKEKVTAFVHAVRIAFEESFTIELNEMREHFVYSESESFAGSLESSDEKSVKRRFTDFDPHADYIKSQFFNPVLVEDSADPHVAKVVADIGTEGGAGIDLSESPSDSPCGSTCGSPGRPGIDHRKRIEAEEREGKIRATPTGGY